MDSKTPAPVSVVIAEDDHEVAEALQALLQLWGYHTAVAHDGQAAIELVQRVEPDIVILDINMPRLTGNQAAAALRALPPRPQPLILIAVTAETSGSERIQQFEAGFDAHVGKPIDPNLLQRTLERLLDARRTLHAYLGDGRAV